MTIMKNQSSLAARGAEVRVVLQYRYYYFCHGSKLSLFFSFFQGPQREGAQDISLFKNCTAPNIFILNVLPNIEIHLHYEMHTKHIVIN